MKTTDFITENQFIGDDAHAMHQDHEVQMARSDCYSSAKYAIELHKLLKNVSEMTGLDGWVSEKLTLANDYLRTVHEYLTHEMVHPEEVMPEMFTAESAEIQFAELLGETAGKQVDMTGKKCTACKKGTYQETSQHDDMDGVLHCTKCNKSVKRHQTANPNKKGMSETTGDTSFDSMMGKIVKGARYKGAAADQRADTAYGSMMNNITKNAADVAKPSANSKFEQVYSAVERILLSNNVHWDIDDDILDALKKLKIKASDALMQKLERELINRVSDALQYYDDSDLAEQAVSEGKRSDRYHIVNKDGKPANLASYADRASAVKDRDEKYPGATVQQVGPRGKVKGVAEGLNEFAQSDFNGGDDSDDLQLYINVAKKLNMKKYKPSTAHNLIAKKMAELVDVVDDDKVDYARQVARKAQGLPNMLEQGVAEGGRLDMSSPEEKAARKAYIKAHGHPPPLTPDSVVAKYNPGDDIKVRDYYLRRKGIPQDKLDKMKEDGVAEAGPGDINRLEHRGAEYNVYFNQRKGMYTARGKGQMSGQIQPEWFHTLADAMDHAEMEIGGYDEHDGVAEAKEKTPGVALSKAYKKDFDGKKPGHHRPETALTGAYSKTSKPGGALKKTGVSETTSSAGMATAPGVGKGPATGTLFGGSYAPKTPFTGKKKAKTSVIKR